MINLPNIFIAKLILSKKSIKLKMKCNTLDIPVFYTLRHATNRYCILQIKLLYTSIWLRYLK